MFLVQLVTALGSREEAEALARSAVQDRAAACAQVLGPVASVYRWEGRLEETQEYLCILKAPESALERLTAFVRERHPYDTPELTAFNSSFVDERYLAWMRSET